MNKTITVKEVITIASDRQNVWDFTQNFNTRRSWDHSILELKLLQKYPYKLIWFRALGGITSKLKYKLCDKPNKTTLKLLDTKSLIIKGGGGSWQYETIGNETQWTQVNSLTLKNKFLFYLFGKITKRMLQRNTKKSMKMAKVLIETNF